MRRLQACLTTLAVLSIAGCGTVTSLQPVGSHPLEVDAVEWEGTWVAGGDSMEIRVVDSVGGQIEVAWIESGTDGFKLETVEVHLRKAGHALLASARETTDDDEFTLLLVAKENSQIMIWWPNGARFEELIAAGKLPGEVTEAGQIRLGTLESKHLELIAGDEQGVLYEWREPIVMFRQPG